MFESVDVDREKPASYGLWWNTNELDESWYAKIYAHRVRAHEFFVDWFSGLVRKGEEIERIIEVGCGRGEPYSKIFASYAFHGADISEKEIAYCRQKHGGPAERFFVADAIKDGLRGIYDLVFAHAVIDHVYDINAFIRALARASRKWIYISSYRSWHPRLEHHIYQWMPELTCYNNDISPREARRVLEGAGCDPIEVFPVFVGNAADNFPLETVITARTSRFT